MNDKQKEIALELAVEVARCLVNPSYRVEKMCSLLRDHAEAADAPKRKYTVKDIEKPKRCVGMNRDYWYIRCGEYDWTSVGWAKQREGSSGFQGHVADVIYAGLVATNNVPEVGE